MESISSLIIKYMESVGDWQFGGAIETAIGGLGNAKNSIVGRRLRELEQEGILEHRYVDNPKGRGAKVVQYRLKPTIDLPPARDPVVDNLQTALL